MAAKVKQSEMMVVKKTIFYLVKYGYFWNGRGFDEGKLAVGVPLS